MVTLKTQRLDLNSSGRDSIDYKLGIKYNWESNKILKMREKGRFSDNNKSENYTGKNYILINSS